MPHLGWLRHDRDKIPGIPVGAVAPRHWSACLSSKQLCPRQTTSMRKETPCVPPEQGGGKQIGFRAFHVLAPFYPSRALSLAGKPSGTRGLGRVCIFAVVPAVALSAARPEPVWLLVLPLGTTGTHWGFLLCLPVSSRCPGLTLQSFVTSFGD